MRRFGGQAEDLDVVVLVGQPQERVAHRPAHEVGPAARRGERVQQAAQARQACAMPTAAIVARPSRGSAAIVETGGASHAEGQGKERHAATQGPYEGGGRKGGRPGTAAPGTGTGGSGDPRVVPHRGGRGGPAHGDRPDVADELPASVVGRDEVQAAAADRPSRRTLDTDDVGDEAPGGSMLNPDLNRVDDIGYAVGVAEEDSGALRASSDLLDRRDQRRALAEGPEANPHAEPAPAQALTAPQARVLHWSWITGGEPPRLVVTPQKQTL